MVDANSKGDQNRTPVFYAVEKSVLDSLVKAGGDIQTPDSEAKVNGKDSKNETALEVFDTKLKALNQELLLQKDLVEDLQKELSEQQGQNPRLKRRVDKASYQLQKLEKKGRRYSENYPGVDIIAYSFTALHRS